MKSTRLDTWLYVYFVCFLLWLLGCCRFRSAVLEQIPRGKIMSNSFCLLKTLFLQKKSITLTGLYQVIRFWTFLDGEVFKLFRSAKNQASCIDGRCCYRCQYHCNPTLEVLTFHDDIVEPTFDSDWQFFPLWYLNFVFKIHFRQ